MDTDINLKVSHAVADFREAFNRFPNRIYLSREDATALGVDLYNAESRVAGMQVRPGGNFAIAFRDPNAPDSDEFESTYTGISARGESTISSGLGLSRRSGGRGAS